MGDRINLNLGFIGAGNMARAICEGMVKKGIQLWNILYFFPTNPYISGLVNYRQISVSAPRETTLEPWKRLGVNTTTSNAKIIEDNDIIFLAVKPHILIPAMDKAYETLGRCKIIGSKLFVSILAGVTIETLENVNILFYYLYSKHFKFLIR